MHSLGGPYGDIHLGHFKNTLIELNKPFFLHDSYIFTYTHLITENSKSRLTVWFQLTPQNKSQTIRKVNVNTASLRESSKVIEQRSTAVSHARCLYEDWILCADPRVTGSILPGQ